MPFHVNTGLFEVQAARSCIEVGEKISCEQSFFQILHISPTFHQIIYFTKAELPQQGIFFRTQFPSMGIFINKKVGFRKN